MVRRDDRPPAHPVLLAIGYGVLGLIAGALSLWLLPHSLMHTRFGRIACLLLAPVASGLADGPAGRLAGSAAVQAVVGLDRFFYGYVFALAHGRWYASTAHTEEGSPMCRNIRTLFNFEPPATDDEVHAAALQFVRKLSGFNAPSRLNQAAFDRATQDIARLRPHADRRADHHRRPARTAARSRPNARVHARRPALPRLRRRSEVRCLRFRHVVMHSAGRELAARRAVLPAAGPDGPCRALPPDAGGRHAGAGRAVPQRCRGRHDGQRTRRRRRTAAGLRGWPTPPCNPAC